LNQTGLDSLRLQWIGIQVQHCEKNRARQVAPPCTGVIHENSAGACNLTCTCHPATYYTTVQLQHSHRHRLKLGTCSPPPMGQLAKLLDIPDAPCLFPSSPCPDSSTPCALCLPTGSVWCNPSDIHRPTPTHRAHPPPRALGVRTHQVPILSHQGAPTCRAAGRGGPGLGTGGPELWEGPHYLGGGGDWCDHYSRWKE
jgi:hypothetical protein